MRFHGFPDQVEEQDEEVDLNTEIFLEIDLFGMMELAADERTDNDDF